MGQCIRFINYEETDKIIEGIDPGVKTIIKIQITTTGKVTPEQKGIIEEYVSRLQDKLYIPKS